MPTLPLFPLNTILLPGGVLALRIFERRYVDMVRRSLRENSGFGIVSIRRILFRGQGGVQPRYPSGHVGHVFPVPRSG